MNSIKINSINSNLTFKSIKNISKPAKTITKNILVPTIVLGSSVGATISYQNKNQEIKEKIRVREQAKRYNKKEPDNYEKFRDDLINRIMNLNKKIQEKGDAGEEMSSEEITKSLRSEKMEENRLPDFSEKDYDYDLYHIDSDHSDVELKDFKKEAAIIKNKQLKTIAETMCKKEQLNRSVLSCIRDIDAGLNNITDTKILKHLKAELKRLADIDYDTKNYEDPEIGELEYFYSLNSIAEIVDVYNTMTGRYSRYKSADFSVSGSVFIERSKLAAFIKYHRQYAPKNLEAFIKALNTESAKKHYMVTDFENAEKTESLELLSNKKEMLDYMYEKYYVQKLDDPNVRKLCREINHKYGTRVLLSAKTKNIQEALKIIKKELGNWTKVSNGNAKLPRILNMNSCDIAYGDAAAYTDIKGNIHHDGAKITSPHIIRHEIMHINEGSIFANFSSDPELAKLVRSIIPSKKEKINGVEKDVLDYDNCKYREEFLKAGIDPEHIEYAYTNKNEFLAVAAEGDLSQYSPEFREVLIKMGMPEYVFDLPIDDYDVEDNVDIVEEILEEHPNASYDELVEYIEIAKAEEMSPREKLLNAIFGRTQK